MSPTPLIHDFPSGLSPSQTKAFEHLTRAYRYLCDAFPHYGTRDEMRDNIDARLLVTSLRDAVLADSFPYYDGRMMDGLTGLVERAEKQ